jgi:hypothetical protein
MFSPGVVLKFVPEIVTVAPGAPWLGLNPDMVGSGNTVKSLALSMVTPLTVIEILPVVAPFGTIVDTLVVVDVVTTAIVLLNFTV